MGYTNYWKSLTKTPKQEILSETFRAEIRKIVDVANKNGIKCHFEESPAYIGVHDDEEHSESFYLDTSASYPGEYYGFSTFCFCKTFGEPFDAVVKCCIVAAIKNNIFEPILSFDGNKSDEEYEKAVMLAKQVGSEFEEIFKSIPVED